MSHALDAGAEDIKNDPEEENYEIITSPEGLNTVKHYLEEKNIPLNLSEVTFIPKNYVNLSAEDAEKVLKLVDALEDHDDMQNVYANFDVPDEVMVKGE
jgi:transcriptional/translational regulatory protein YebC/TACO1